MGPTLFPRTYVRRTYIYLCQSPTLKQRTILHTTKLFFQPHTTPCILPPYKVNHQTDQLRISYFASLSIFVCFFSPPALVVFKKPNWISFIVMANWWTRKKYGPVHLKYLVPLISEYIISSVHDEWH